MHKTVTVDHNKDAELHIWDTLGQEKFFSVAKLFYKGTIGAFIVFDVTNRKSFEDLGRWYEAIIDSCGVSVTITLLGNKCDDGSKREVQYNEAMEFCKKRDINYV